MHVFVQVIVVNASVLVAADDMPKATGSKSEHFRPSNSIAN